jgi:hypothetical protein
MPDSLFLGERAVILFNRLAKARRNFVRPRERKPLVATAVRLLPQVELEFLQLVDGRRLQRLEICGAL